MPTTVIGAILFVVLLLPGYIYNLKAERATPERKLSSLRETSLIAFVSVLWLGVTTLIFTIARILDPRHTPDVGRLVREPMPYIRAHYAYLAWWALGLLAATCILVYLHAIVATHPKVRAHRGAKPGIAAESSWWKLFELEKYRGAPKIVTCHIESGVEITGRLFSFNPSSDDTPDRELTLSGPLLITTGGKTEKVEWGAVSVSARRISWMHVDYMTDKAYDELVEERSKPTPHRDAPQIPSEPTRHESRRG